MNRRLHSIVAPVLYRYDGQHSHPYSLAISWAAEHGMMSLLQKALRYGEIIPIVAIMGPLRRDLERSNLYGRIIRRQRYDCTAHPLVLATQGGHHNIVNALLERGCSLDICDPTELSLLSLAVIRGDCDLVQTFLGLGVRQDSRGFNPHSPIQLAAYYGNEKIVKLLLSERGNNLPTRRNMQEALETALRTGHKHVVQQLLDYGVSLNFLFAERLSVPYKPRPLEWATENGNLGQVQLLLDKGANANCFIHGNTTVLLRAVLKGNPELVEILVRKTDRIPSTIALRWAVQQQDSIIVNTLLVSGVSCDFEEDDEGKLHSHPVSPPDDLGDFVHTFPLEGTFEPQPSDFVPPLIVAIGLGNTSLVRLLIAHGANVNVGYAGLYRSGAHSFWGTALQLATELKYQEIVDLLLESGADPDKKYMGPSWYTRPHQVFSFV